MPGTVLLVLSLRRLELPESLFCWRCPY